MAATRFARNGLVAEFLAGGSNKFFRCPFWSDFADESENLFIGGFMSFTFGSIRNIKTQQNYEVYVQAISMFQWFIHGSPWITTITSIKKKHCFAINQLIEEEIAQKVVNGESSLVPDYILCLWHNLLVNVKHIELHWNLMDFEAFTSKRQNFKCGYKSYSAWCCNDDTTAPDFGAILQLLPNLEMLRIFGGNGFEKSVTLEPETVSNLAKSLQTHSAVYQIDIANPKLNIRQFVSENQGQFEQIGWSISQKPFSFSNRNNKSVCKANLCIERI